MYKNHYDQYFKHKFTLTVTEEVNGQIKSGKLESPTLTVPIINFIPRFCPMQESTQSFGFQWNKFKTTQLDSKNGKSLSQDRFFKFTKWSKDELRGKKVLEIGCGPGRFTEILIGCGANVVSFDSSNAIDVCFENVKSDRLCLFQGDLFNMPIEKNSFDFVFCFGVLQHTSDPIGAFEAITQYIKPGGKLSIDNYINILLSPFCTPKYIWRLFTPKINPKTLLAIIKFYMPIWLPIDTAIRSIPKLGPRILALIPIPCFNYIGMGLSYDERLEWAILDTFDALSPQYDYPKKISDFETICRKLSLNHFEIFYGSNGLVVNAIK